MQRTNERIIGDLFQLLRSQALGMWRFRWISLAVAWSVFIVGWLIIYLMPDIYEAQARVYVDAENAIEEFLGGIAAPTDVMSEVAVVVREIVSRPNLAEVAQNTDLALRASTSAQFEELLTSLQKRISVSGNRDDIYSISFRDSNRETAIAVVDSLLTAFVEKSLGADRTDSAKAQKFLENQIEVYEQRLTAAEDRLASFRRENVEYLHDEQGDYFSRLQAAQDALKDTEGELNLAIRRQTELQRQLSGEEPVFGITPVTPAAPSAKIAELEQQLEELRLRYTDRHPRIGQILDTIEMLREQENAEQANTNRPVAQSPLDLNPVYQNMRIQLSNVEVEVAALRAQRSQQQAEVDRLRRMVDTIPEVEAELSRLNRDYGVVRSKHQQLLQQLETANIGEDVSRSIDEIQFRIIEPPYSGMDPVGPNRTLFLVALFVLTLGFAVAAAFVLNLVRPTYIGSRFVTESLGIPVLASVSLLQTDRQVRSERRNRMALQAAVVVLVASLSLAIMYADRGSLLLRELVESIV